MMSLKQLSEWVHAAFCKGGLDCGNLVFLLAVQPGILSKAASDLLLPQQAAIMLV